MIAVDKSELRRNRIYLMYYQNKEDTRKSLFFFTYREHVNDTVIKVVVHGKILQHNNRTVNDLFWKTEDLLSLTTDNGTATLFEINFTQFAHHVVSETI